MKTFYTTLIIVLFTTLISCHRADEDLDVTAQEEISNIILLVKDNQTGMVQTCNYTANATQNPNITLENGKNYTVDIVFKNGNEDTTSEIIAAKDEHFLTFQFTDANIQLTRLNGANDLRSDGNRVGIQTKWDVISLTNPTAKLVLTLNHAAISTSELQNNNTFGSTNGGETDAEASYHLKN